MREGKSATFVCLFVSSFGGKNVALLLKNIEIKLSDVDISTISLTLFRPGFFFASQDRGGGAPEALPL